MKKIKYSILNLNPYKYAHRNKITNHIGINSNINFNIFWIMKIKKVFNIILIMTLVYLSGSFIAKDINAFNWQIEGRVFFLFVSLAVCSFPPIYDKL